MATKTAPESAPPRLATTYGDFDMHVFERGNARTDVVLVRGRQTDHRVPLVRVQAHCLTGTAFGSTMCDCSAQLAASFEIIRRAPFGAIVYLDQEGRNYGLASKAQIIRLMNEGRTLEQAQQACGRARSRLDYSGVCAMLEAAGLRGPIDLLVGSPAKADALSKAGVDIRRVVLLNPKG